jgi:hypothetical protein
VQATGRRHGRQERQQQMPLLPPGRGCVVP